MKTIHVINPHSFVDVITNSSSELFVCGKGKTIEEIENLISSHCPMLTGYVVKGLSEDQTLFVKNKKLLKKETISRGYGWTETAFMIPKSWSDAKCEELFGDMYHGDWNPDKKRYEKPYRITDYYGYLDTLELDSVLVVSEESNSIDSDYFDLLENVLNAERYHLG